MSEPGVASETELPSSNTPETAESDGDEKFQTRDDPECQIQSCSKPSQTLTPGKHLSRSSCSRVAEGPVSPRGLNGIFQRRLKNRGPFDSERGDYTVYGIRHAPYQCVMNLVRAKLEPERQPRKFLHPIDRNCLSYEVANQKYLVDDSKMQEVVELIVKEIRGIPIDMPETFGRASISSFWLSNEIGSLNYVAENLPLLHDISCMQNLQQPSSFRSRHS